MQLLQELVGKKVTVFSLQAEAERQDVGVLEAFDEQVLKLRKGESEVLYLFFIRIRQIKPF